MLWRTSQLGGRPVSGWFADRGVLAATISQACSSRANTLDLAAGKTFDSNAVHVTAKIKGEVVGLETQPVLFTLAKVNKAGQGLRSGGAYLSVCHV